MKEKLTAIAENASEWYRNNLLKGNFGKYNTMTMYCNHSHHDKDDIPLRIQGTEIDSVDSLRLLDVTVGERMNFNEHINNICKKTGQRVGVVMRLKNLIPTNAKLQLFKSSILPNLTYCYLTWHFCKASDTRRLEQIQERGLRAIFEDTLSTYQELLDRAKLPTLLNRRLSNIAILMFKVNLNSSSYNFRSSEFTISRFNTVTYGKHSMRYLGPKL